MRAEHPLTGQCQMGGEVVVPVEVPSSQTLHSAVTRGTTRAIGFPGCPQRRCERRRTESFRWAISRAETRLPFPLGLRVPPRGPLGAVVILEDVVASTSNVVVLPANVFPKNLHGCKRIGGGALDAKALDDKNEDLHAPAHPAGNLGRCVGTRGGLAVHAQPSRTASDLEATRAVLGPP